MERETLEQAFATQATPAIALPTGRTTVRRWTVDDLMKAAANSSTPVDSARGRQMFSAVGCFVCHTVAGEGGALGPDLTHVATRLALRDLLEAIVEPSREISDQYGTVVITLRNGNQHSGRIINYTEQGLQLAEDLLDPANARRIPEAEIARIEPSKTSLMPAGLIDVLESSEVLDLIAFLSTSAGVR